MINRITTAATMIIINLRVLLRPELDEEMGTHAVMLLLPAALVKPTEQGS